MLSNVLLNIIDVQIEFKLIIDYRWTIDYDFSNFLFYLFTHFLITYEDIYL